MKKRDPHIGCNVTLPPSAQDAQAASVDIIEAEANAEIVLPTRTDEDGEIIPSATPTTPAQVIDQMAEGFLDHLLGKIGHEPFIDV